MSLIRTLLDLSQGRWTVVVTVRIYDATRSHSLRSLFRLPSSLPPAKGININDTRRYHIPKLTPDEVLSGVAQIDGLRPLYDEGTSEFRTLLDTPFNLWLVQQILGTGGDNRQLSALASEVQLLSLYWQRRVDAGDRAIEARHILSRMVGQMVDAHSLSVRSGEVYDLSAASVWDDLLSAGVVARVGTTQLRFAFAHNTLFDFAVSVLLMDDEPKAMHDFLAEDVGRPVFLRPSITFYYTRLWHSNREAFWASTWTTLASKKPHVALVGRLVPPTVIVREARALGDLEPLLTPANKESHVTEIILRLMQAIAALNPTNEELWADLCASLARGPRREYAWNITVVGYTIAEKHSTALTGSLRTALGLLGRRMLRWALDNRGGPDERLADGVGSLWAVPLIARTFDSDPTESTSLLRRVLDLLDERGFPIQYFTRLCDNVAVLAGPAPELVGDLYRAIFSHTEVSEEETTFGTPVLPLRSTRRQDFGMCEYILDREFDAFLAQAPQHAIAAGLDAFSMYVIADYVLPYLREGKSVHDLQYTLRFRAKNIPVVADHSAIWLNSGRRESATHLLTKVLTWLRQAVERQDIDAVRNTLDTFAQHAAVEAAWIQLLDAGAAFPTVLGAELAGLTTSRELQRHAFYNLGKFVSATAVHWSDAQRSAFETSVENLYREGDTPEDALSLRKLADRLTATLPREATSSRVLLQRREELESAGAVPKNEPPARIYTETRAFTDRDWLAEKGVNVEAPSTSELLDKATALDEETRRWQNRRAPAREVVTLLDQMLKAQSDLDNTSDVAPEVAHLVATRIAAAAAVIAEAEGDAPLEMMATARLVLLAAAYRPHRLSEEELSREFDTPAWSPSPQTAAAQGLPWLIIRSRDEEVLEAIEHLVGSPDPAVRFLTASELFRIRGNADDRFWLIMDRIAESETSKGVLAGFLHSLGAIGGKDASRVAAMLAKLSERGLGPDDRSHYAESYVGLLAWLALNVEEEWAVARANKVAQAPLDDPELAKRLVFEALTLVTPHYLADQRVRPMSLRAVAWVQRVIQSIRGSSDESLSDDANIDRGRTAYEILDSIATRIYLNVRGDGEGDDRADGLADYFEITRPLVRELVEFGKRADTMILAPTAHHLMQFLHLVLPLDPPGVLHLAAEVVTSSARAGYNLDSLAVREVVEIAEEVLADHRGSVVEGNALEDFVRLLDVFANQGWPDALRLIWRIDEIFR